MSPHEAEARPADRDPPREGEVECHWCEEEQEYELEGISQDPIVRCEECGLRIWIRGDGWEKYAEVHELTPGCLVPESSNNEFISSMTSEYIGSSSAPIDTSNSDFDLVYNLGYRNDTR